MKKNDIIELSITGVTTEGNGIGRYEGMAVFVPLTAVGDVLSVRIVKVKKSYAYGIIEQLLCPSEDRIESDCSCFRRCGGCSFRHISYEAECRIKQDRVYDSMKRIGGIDLHPQPILPATEQARYRNKAQYPIDPDGYCGFYAVHSHRIIPCSDCFLQPTEFTLATEILGEWIRAFKVPTYDEKTHSGLLRHVYLRKAFATGELMAVLVINGKSVPHSEDLVARLRDKLGEPLKSMQLNINTKDTNVILGEKCKILYGSSYITDLLCGVEIRISPLSFYQVNRTMAEQLYRKAAEYAKPQGKKILDLYCGAGTIGLSMAGLAESVIGVEIIEQAVEDAKQNALINGINNARFLCADAKTAAKDLATQGIHADVVILDPPRKGCDPELLETVSNDFVPERLVYVSCDPATLARDAAILKKLGYFVVEYTPIDLFPRTAHVETVALMSRDVVFEK